MKTITAIIILTFLFFTGNVIQAQKLRNNIVKSISQIEETYDSIQDERKVMLDQLASRIFKGHKTDKNSTVVFIDRHNKQKSQLAAIWLKTGLIHYDLLDFSILSAGIKILKEPFPALAVLEEYGFKVSNASGNELYSYNVKSGSEKWTVSYNSYEALNLNDEKAIKIYVEKQIAPEGGPKQIEVPLSESENIAREMLYVASKIKYLSSQQL